MLTMDEAVDALVERLPDATLATAVVEWYNRSELDAEDLSRLVELCEAGGFFLEECDVCGEGFGRGDPKDWGHFQGVSQTEMRYVQVNGHDKYICEGCLRDNPALSILL